MRALITGITGQDGSFLAENLLEKGYDVYGLVRRTSAGSYGRIEHLTEKVTLLDGNLRDMDSIRRALKISHPDEIYNLAAQSDVGVSFKCPDETFEVNWLGLGRLINCAREEGLTPRIYQASTSELFGEVKETPQSENTPFNPVSPYGHSKLRAHEDFVVRYREMRDMFIVSGILFNHESERRGEKFVTRKITRGLASIHLGIEDTLSLGNLNASRDWGYAKEYVEAMRLMLQQKTPSDFVISSGKTHSIREFALYTAKHLGMELKFEGEGVDEVGIDQHTGKVIIRVNPKFFRPNEVNTLKGNPSKAREMLGWVPKTDLEGLVKIMTNHDLKELKQSLKE